MACRKLNITDYFRFAEAKKIIDHEVTDLCFPQEKINFSSEYQDTESSLVYYNYRYYSPELGRWLSRDPIGEDGGKNLYAMVGNRAVDKWDELGLRTPFIRPYVRTGTILHQSLQGTNAARNRNLCVLQAKEHPNGTNWIGDIYSYTSYGAFGLSSTTDYLVLCIKDKCGNVSASYLTSTGEEMMTDPVPGSEI